MLRKLLMGFWLLSLPAFAAADSQWVLDQSTLTYHVSHPLHHFRRCQPCGKRARAFAKTGNVIF